MSLKTYFPEQFDQIKEFMASAAEIVRCVRIDPEMKPMFTKALAKMEDNDEFPHALVAYREPFKDPNQYFDGLFDLISTQYEQNAKALEEQGTRFGIPFNEKDPPPAPFRFLRYAEALTDSLSDHVGSLVFLFDPEEIADEDGYRRSIDFLASKTKSDWLKFLVLDPRAAPVIELPENGNKRIGFQTFYLSPEEIEKRTEEALEAPGALAPVERRQYKGLLAGFASARKEHEQAETLQREWLTEAEGEGEPAEVAAALYNLGNTLVAKGDHAEATGVYCRACDICVDNKLASLAPLVYVNLGVCLHRQGDLQQATASLKVARDIFKAQNMRPGEAYVVDTLAQIYAHDGENEKAEQAWRYALSLYDGITASQFSDLRENGRSDILEKLKRFHEKTGPKGDVEAPGETEGGHGAR